MQRFHRTLSTAVAASALLSAFAFNANAQTAGSTQPQATAAHAQSHVGQRTHQKDFGQRHTERMQRLKTLLQLQPNQQAAFDQYVQATMPQPHQHTTKAERPDWSKLTTPERVEQAQKLRQQRTVKAQQRAQATLSFYSSLTASQQKAFDELTARASAKHKTRHGQHKGHHHTTPAGSATQQAAPAA